MNHLPRKSRTRKLESTAAPTRTIACEASVKMSVLRTARRKLSSCHGVREVVEADPVAGQRPADRVGEAEVDRPDERDADDERHEDDGRRDQQRREDAAALESVPPATTGRFQPRSLRLHWDRAMLVDCGRGGRHGRDHPREPDEGLSRRHAGRDRPRPRGRERRVRRLRRAVGLRQDDRAADDRRPRVDHLRERCGSTARSSTTCRRRTATSRWSSRTTRSTRT